MDTKEGRQKLCIEKNNLIECISFLCAVLDLCTSWHFHPAFYPKMCIKIQERKHSAMGSS